ncbi:MAG: AAA family ATPase [Gemmatales bacterium]
MSAPLTEPYAISERLARLEGQQHSLTQRLALNQNERDQLQKMLDLASEVEGALKTLSGQLFADLLHQLEKSLSLALQDVLEQPLQLIALPDFKRGSMNIDFVIERDGEREHIMHGQGGSVANVLSVGLRMFALAQRQESHRQLLVLDEPDCWLQPELVPRLVKIIKLAGERLGIQVILVSHHQSDYFAEAAERMYRLVPAANGVKVETVK